MISDSEAPSKTGVEKYRPSDFGGPAEVGFQDLAHIHTGRHAERIQHDLHRGPVRQVGHILFRQDARDHALVAVAPGHLVADGELALHGHIDLDHFDDAGRQLVAAAQLGQLLFVEGLENLDLLVRLLFEALDALVDLPFLLRLEVVFDLVQLGRAEPGQHGAGQFGFRLAARPRRSGW